MRELKQSEVQEVSGGLFSLFSWGRKSCGSYGRNSYSRSICAPKSYSSYGKTSYRSKFSFRCW